MRPATHSYGLVLALVAASIVFQMATSGDGSERLITLLLQAATLVAAMRAAGPHRRWVRAGALIALLVALVGTITVIADGKLPEAPAAIVSGLLVAIAPVVLAAGLLRDVRSVGVTLHTLAGVLAIYLLLGMFFAFVYGAFGAIDGSELFRDIGAGTPADRLYFSFVTLCTVGYGDIVPAGDVTRTAAVGEMLVGQIYLVTVVSVIVSNLTPRRAA